ncbi:hypothetical protein E5D57_003594 [Metarhizium anisopliae]|nr:hypothetical protein E5D57_003594 [Metarhizium anisopliae]
MPAEARSISVICDSHPRRIRHADIRLENPSVPRCGFCGKLWPQEIIVDDSDSEVISEARLQRSLSSTTGYITSQGRALSDLTRSASPASSSSSALGRSVNLKQFKHFEQMRREANQATRAAKAASPFENPIGLKIRVKALHSDGYNLRGGFFKAEKTTSLGIKTRLSRIISITNCYLGGLDLPLIPWNTLRSISKDYFTSKYLSNLWKDSNATDRPNIVFGVSFERVGKSETGTFISVAFEREPFESIADIFNTDANYTWAIEDGRVVLWIDIRFTGDQPKPQPKKPRVRSKGRSRPTTSNISVGDSIEVAPQSALADHIEEVKGELAREVISLEAFPPAEAAESDSEAHQGDQEEEAQLEYDAPQADSADKGPQEALQEEETHQNHQPSRKRLRGPTLDSDDEPLIPRLSRYGRATRATAKARSSQS